jgi:hypothetical protein
MDNSTQPTSAQPMAMVTNTGRIRQAIRQANEQEKATHTLRKFVQTQVPLLHESIQLPKKNAADALMDFVVRYISHVPNFLDAIEGLTKEAGIHNYASTFLHIAEDFFIKPPDVIGTHSGLESLLDKAYLAHRLIEEVNDRVIARYGIPLAPMDMTRANLIVHQLIGEPYANELDFAVFYSTEVNLPDEFKVDDAAFRRYIDVHKSNGWGAELGRWPCLAEDLSINLNFALSDKTPPIVH